MSVVDDMLQRYKEIRLRLRYPPNAVPDTGINLGRNREQPKPQLPPPPLPFPKIEFEQVPPLPPIVEQPTTGVTFCSTLSITAKEFGLSFNQIRAKCRKKNVVFPRQVAIYIACKQQKWTISRIGHYLNIDHTTAMYARNRIASKIEGDPELRDRIKEIEDKIETLCNRPSSANEHQPTLAEGQRGSDLPQ